MGTETMKGSNYAWAIAIACVAFYAIPLGVVANQAGLFASPVMEEFGWSRTDATLYMSIQPWVAAICTPFAGKLISKFNPRWVMTAAAAVFGLASLACAWFTEPWQWNVYGVLYGAVVESYCSEQSARRMAMEAASDNAGEMIENLNLSYNRARQAAITQEITEIVAGSGEVGA